jgi:hypothetical protein
VGTLISALAFWFAILVVPSSVVTGVLIFGGGVAFAMYSVAGFSRADDPMNAGFAAAITALVAAAGVAVFAQAVDVRGILAIAPVVAIGVGGTRGLAPTKDKSRNLVRLVATGVVVVAMYFLFTVEITAYGLIAPLVPLPALGIADRFFERGREIADEDVG